MKTLKRLFIIFAVANFAPTQNAFAQVNLDMESGDREGDAANCWEFNGVGYTKDRTVNGDWSGITEELVKNDPKSIVSPWIVFGAGQSISFGHRLTEDKYSDWKACYVLSQKYDDKGTNKFDTLYWHSYNNGSAQNNEWANISVPFSFNTQVRKVYIVFAGEGSNERAIVDDINIGGSYFADPKNNCEPQSALDDKDGDGVADLFDAFPNDKFKAYAFSFPEDNGSGSDHGTLMFEDLWPSRGDYDFNDMVINYRVTIAMNSEGNLTDITFNMVTRAWGASNKNGIALQFNGLSPDKILEVSGYKNFSNSPFKLAANGTEDGNKFANVVFVSDVTQALVYPGGGTTGVNVFPKSPFVPYDTTIITVKFMDEGKTAPGGVTTMQDFDGDIMNPYMIIAQDRGREVHLANQMPTEKADMKLFGTGDDDSKPSENRWYKTKDNLPWAIAVDWGSVPYMIEKSDITTGFRKLIPWVTSEGREYWDWYMDEKGYRDEEKLYIHK